MRRDRLWRLCTSFKYISTINLTTSIKNCDRVEILFPNINAASDFDFPLFSVSLSLSTFLFLSVFFFFFILSVSSSDSARGSVYFFLCVSPVVSTVFHLGRARTTCLNPWLRRVHRTEKEK